MTVRGLMHTNRGAGVVDLGGWQGGGSGQHPTTTRALDVPSGHIA